MSNQNRRTSLSVSNLLWFFLTLFLLIGGVSGNAHAANLVFDVTRGDTGGLIGPLNTIGDDLCPAVTTTGCDTSSSDDLVRTNDGVGYEFAVQVDPPGDNVYIDTTLKAGMVWDQLPGSCNPFTSTITGDGTPGNESRLVCDLGFQSSWAANLTFVGRVLGDNPNGSMTGIESATFYGDASAPLVEDVTGLVDVQVTAKPHYNLRKQIRTYRPGQHLGADGFIIEYLFVVETRKLNTNGNGTDDPDPLLGNEIAVSPISFVEDVSAISPNAYVYQCDQPVSYNMPYPNFNAAQPERSVLDAGDVSCSATGPGSGNPTVTIANADLSLSHYPTEYSTGSAISNDNRIASYGRLIVFIPLTDVLVLPGGELLTTNTYTGFNPASTTQSNFEGAPQGPGGGEYTDDNKVSFRVSEGAGSFSHTYRCYTSGGVNPGWCTDNLWYAGPTTATAVASGDGAGQPDQIHAAYTYYRNNLFTAETTAQVCSILDTRYSEVTPYSGSNVARCHGTCGSIGTDYVIEYATGYIDGTFRDKSTVASGDVPTECGDPGIVWHSTPAAAQATGEISKVRLRKLTPLPAGGVLALTTSLKVKDLPSLSGVSSGTLIKTWGSAESERSFPAYRNCTYTSGVHPTPLHSTNSCGDRLYLTRAEARLDKRTIPNDIVNVMNAGGNVTFGLRPTFTAVNAGLTDNVSVVDELPIGLEYMPNSAKQSGVPFEPVVTGTPATGQTLTWDLGLRTVNDPIDEITFTASTPLTTMNGTNLDNVAYVDALIDDSTQEQRGDVRRVTVTAPASMLMGKSVSPTIIDQNDIATFTVSYLNTTSLIFNEVDIIDVMPLNNDSRLPSSSFNGNFAVENINPQSTSVQVYLSSDPHAGIATDPQLASNDFATGTTNWCPATALHTINPAAVPTIGGTTADCPANTSEITAIRIIDTEPLGISEIRNFSFDLDTDSNFGGDLYTNQAQGTSDGITLSPQTPFVTFQVREAENVGLAKSVFDVTDEVVTLHFTATNYGNTPLNSFQITDNLDATFGANNYEIDAGPSIVAPAPALGGIVTNANFDGTGDINLLDAGSVLWPGETVVISVAVEVTMVTDQGNGLGVYSNTAELTATTPSGVPVSDTSDNGTNPDESGNGSGSDAGEDDPTPITVAPTDGIEVTKSSSTALLSTPIIVGDEIVYDFVIENTGNTLLTGVTLDDPLFTPSDITSSCTFPATAGELRPAQTATCSINYPIVATDLTNVGVINQAIAGGTSPVGPVSDDSDSTNPHDSGAGDDDATTTPLVNAYLELIKTDDVSALSSPVSEGDVITYTFTAENTGNVTLTSVALTDTLTNNDGTVLALTSGPTFQSADASSAEGSLVPGETATYEATYELTQADIDSGGVSNTATANAEDPSGGAVSDISDDPDDATNTDTNGNGTGDDATSSSLTQAPSLELIKTDDLSALSSPPIPGDVITFTFTAENTGNVTLSSVALTDTLTNNDGTVLALTSGPTFQSADASSAEGSLVPGETATYEATYELTLADINSGGVSNTATVNAEDPAGGAVSDISDDPDDATNTDTNGNGTGDDATSSPFTQAPSLELIKTDDLSALSSPPMPGDVITFTFTAENTGNVTLSSVAITDTLTNNDGAVLALTSGPTFQSADASSAEGSLVPGETATYEATYAITHDDIIAGGVSNTATVNAEDPAGGAVSDISDDPDDATNTDTNGNGTGDDATSSSLTQAPSLAVEKADVTSALSTPVAEGDTLSWTITVTNTGNLNLTSVSPTDTLTNNDGATLTLTSGPDFVSADASSAEGSLLIGETATYEATYELTQADINTGGVNNVVVFDALDPNGTAVSDISDDPDDATNTDTNGNGTGDDTTSTSFAQVKSIEFIKADDVSALSSPVADGDVITYTFTAENTGNVTLTSVAITDTLTNNDGTVLALTSGPTFQSADASSAEGTLVPGETATYEATYALTQADIDSGGVSNTATVNAEDPDGGAVSDISDDPDGPLSDPDDPTGTSFVPTAGMDVVKTDDLSGLGTPPAVGEIVTWTIQVRNTGNVTLDNIALTDTLTNNDGATQTLTSGPDFVSADASSAEGSLVPGETATYEASYALTQADLNSGSLSNTVSVNATLPDATTISDNSDDPDNSDNVDPNGDGNADDPTVTPSLSSPSIALEKIDDVSGFATPVVSGNLITYTFEVTNTGNVDLDSISLSDTLTNNDGTVLALTSGPTFQSADQGSPVGSLVPGEVATYEATYALTQDDIDSGGVSNTASVDAEDPDGGAVSDVSDDPDNSADADPNGDGNPDDPTQTVLSQVPSLSLAKTDDTSAFSTPVTVGDVITYTFTAENTGNVTLTSVALTDTLTNSDGAVLALTSGPTFQSADQGSSVGSLVPGEVATYEATYALTQADIDSGGVSNAATANAQDPNGGAVSDASDDPDNTADADPNGDGNPDDPTQTVLSQVPELSLNKELVGQVQQFPYVYDLTYRLSVENIGNVTLNNVQIADDLATALAPAQLLSTPTVTLTGLPASFVANPAYDGATFIDTLSAGAILAPTESGTIDVTVRVNFYAGLPTGAGNVAAASSTEITGDVISDDPTIGGDSDPTPVTIVDSDGDGVTDEDEGLQDNDGDSLANSVDYDPTGYLYCEETGQILTGGQITITGPLGAQTGVGTSNNITIASDGSNGFYQFFVTVAGQYTLTYTNPTLGQPSTSHLSSGPLDVTSLLPSNPGIIGSSENASTGFLIDYTPGANPYHAVFDIEDGDPSVFNNNLPFQMCGAPELTATKQIVGTPEVLANGSTQVVYDLAVTNTGDVPVNNVELSDDLDAAFGAGNYVVDGLVFSSTPAIAGLASNAGFNGGSDTLLLQPFTMALNDQASVRLTVTVTPATTATYTNTFNADGISSADGSAAPTGTASVDVELDAPQGVPNLVVEKSADRQVIQIGGSVSYTIVVTNPHDLQRGPFSLVDALPTGLVYTPTTAMVDGVATEPILDGTRLVFTDITLAAGASSTITLSARVGGANVGEEVTNIAYAVDPTTGNAISNLAKAIVRREVEHVFDCGEIIGKVFDDIDHDGNQDRGERGLPGVRIATVKGLLITTDKHGRYSVPCAALPDGDIGSNFILKVDTRTLPTGYRITTENPRVVRLTRGKLTKVNFGATVSRVFKIDLSERAFKQGSAQPKTAVDPVLDQIVQRLRAERSVLRLNYHAKGDRKLGKRRLAAIEKALRAKWKRRGNYRLSIEHRVLGRK